MNLITGHSAVAYSLFLQGKPKEITIPDLQTAARRILRAFNLVLADKVQGNSKGQGKKMADQAKETLLDALDKKVSKAFKLSTKRARNDATAQLKDALDQWMQVFRDMAGNGGFGGPVAVHIEYGKLEARLNQVQIDHLVIAEGAPFKSSYGGSKPGGKEKKAEFRCTFGTKCKFCPLGTCRQQKKWKETHEE